MEVIEPLLSFAESDFWVWVTGLGIYYIFGSKSCRVIRKYKDRIVRVELLGTSFRFITDKQVRVLHTAVQMSYSTKTRPQLKEQTVAHKTVSGMLPYVKYISVFHSWSH